MKNQTPVSETIHAVAKNDNVLGFYSAILTTIVTVVTFGIAIFTPPLSGPFCKEGCVEYPYNDIISRFPRDYLWMYPAILMMLLFVVLMVCIHHFASDKKKIFSQMGLSFAIISATILLIDYFIQLSVIQPSLLKGETEGIALITQYNPHGLFIVLEEIGFFIMSVALVCLVPVFSGSNRIERALRWTFIISFILAISAFIILSCFYSLEREYRFEVAVITIEWMTLIVSGILLSLVFRRAMRKSV